MSLPIKAVMIDLSGTVHIGNQLIPNISQAIDKLKEKSIPYKFVTNTSKESLASLVSRLDSAGLQVHPNEIFTSLSAARKYVDLKGLRPMLLLENAALPDFSGIKTENPNCVVVGLSPNNFHYERLNEAFRLVKSGCELVAINKSRYYQREDGLALGTGAFVSALEFSSDQKAHVVGKPEKAFFQLALTELYSQVSAGETLMIGDDIRDDILGAQQAGFQGALVKTGKYQPGDENKYGTPDFVFTSAVEAIDYVCSQVE